MHQLYSLYPSSQFLIHQLHSLYPSSQSLIHQLYSLYPSSQSLIHQLYSLYPSSQSLMHQLYSLYKSSQSIIHQLYSLYRSSQSIIHHTDRNWSMCITDQCKQHSSVFRDFEMECLVFIVLGTTCMGAGICTCMFSCWLKKEVDHERAQVNDFFPTLIAV